MNTLPRIIEIDDKQYEARTHHKETGWPYFPGFELTATTRDHSTEFTHFCVVRIKTDGLYYDIKCAHKYAIDERNVDRNAQIYILHELMSRFTQQIHSVQQLYKTDHNEPSDYQMDEKLRTMIIYHPVEATDMIRNYIKEKP